MNQNERMLESFTEYCKKHPEQRFFQALRNWVSDNIDDKVNFIFVGSQSFIEMEKTEEALSQLRDTFYWQDDKLGPTRD